ncbi:unnamed protein product, partial [Protopolystoma xenopodis]
MGKNPNLNASCRNVSCNWLHSCLDPTLWIPDVPGLRDPALAEFLQTRALAVLEAYELACRKTDQSNRPDSVATARLGRLLVRLAGLRQVEPCFVERAFFGHLLGSPSLPQILTGLLQRDLRQTAVPKTSDASLTLPPSRQTLLFCPPSNNDINTKITSSPRSLSTCAVSPTDASTDRPKDVPVGETEPQIWPNPHSQTQLAAPTPVS